MVTKQNPTHINQSKTGVVHSPQVPGMALAATRLKRAPVVRCTTGGALTYEATLGSLDIVWEMYWIEQ